MNPITNFEIYKFYERETKITTEDIALICTHAMELLEKEGLEKTSSQESISFLKAIIDITLEKHTYNFNNDDYRKLTNSASVSSNYSKVIKDNNGKYTCYPFSVVTPAYYDIIINHCLTNNSTIEESSVILNSKIEHDNQSKTKSFLESDFNFFHGNVNYILCRSLAIIDSMQMLLKRQDITEADRELIINTYSEANYTFSIMLGLAEINDVNFLRENDYSDKKIQISKEHYDFMVETYKKMIDSENLLKPISQKIWNTYSATNSGMLIHKLTSKIVESDKMEKICTFFYSNNSAIAPEYIGNTGYCYNMNMDNVLSLCETDAGSWKITKEEFIRRQFSSNVQFDETGFWYEYPYHSKLFSPEYIENQVLKNNDFAEILLNNTTQKNKPIMAFYTPDASKEEIQLITEMAAKQNLELMQLSFNKNSNYNK